MQSNKQSVSNRKTIQWLKDAWHLAKPYWTSEEKWYGLGLITIVVFFNLLFVYMTVVSNNWYNGFYDAIQRYDLKAFNQFIIKFLYIAFFYIGFQILASYFRKFLEIRWRKWMTNYYMENWLNKQAYYKTRFLPTYSDNPDQRISEDINSFIVLFLDLTLGLLTSVVSLASFVVILWHIGGVFAFKLSGHEIIIKGYMVWAALVYAAVGTWITFKIGKPLIKLDFQQQTVEADFRFSLMRIREYGENIAFYHGENQEKHNLLQRFNAVVNNFVAIIYRNMKIGIFNIGYNQLAVIFPLVVTAPRYFAKLIKLGDVMQISSAFARVQDAFSYFLNSYTSLASWRAVMDRLYGFQDVISQAVELEGIQKGDCKEANIAVTNLNLSLPDGKPLVKEINFNLSSGDRILIKGRSGCGKTTLLRCLAGLWPYAEGKIALHSGKKELFIAQRPYIPYGSLRQAICYPLTENLPNDDKLMEVLQQCGIGYLANSLDELADWGKILSLGEQQRVAFGRILTNKPDIVYLDEATSALDEEMEQHLYQLLVNQLPNSSIISVGHRSTLQQWHTQEINFNDLQSV